MSDQEIHVMHMGTCVHGDPEERGQLFAALAKAQSKYKKPEESGKNPHLRVKYRSTDDLLEAALPALNAEGLCVMQHPCVSPNPNTHIAITTIVGHSGGAYVASSAMSTLTDHKGNIHRAQVEGQHYTYLARYSFAKTLCVGAGPDEDLDSAAPPPPAETPTPAGDGPDWLEGLANAQTSEELHKIGNAIQSAAHSIPPKELTKLRRAAKEARERIEKS